MSHDIFVQGFADGDAGPIDASALHEVFGPWVVAAESDDDFWRVRAADGGEADIHGVRTADEGIMVNHLGVGQVVELLVAYAARAGAVLLPVGCLTMITHEEQRGELPDGLRDGPVALVQTGPAFLAAMGT